MYVELRPVKDSTAGVLERWYLVLMADNKEPLAHSQPYVTKWNAKRASRRNFNLEPIDVTKDKDYKKFGAGK